MTNDRKNKTIREVTNMTLPIIQLSRDIRNAQRYAAPGSFWSILEINTMFHSHRAFLHVESDTHQNLGPVQSPDSVLSHCD
jgi:hypothetical protein